MSLNLEVAEKAHLSEILALIARETGEVVNKYFRQLPGVELKEDRSLVTVADKLAEEKARNIIMREFPDHGILGEEFGQHNADSPFQWVIDPIDGTTSFVAGAFDFGSVVGLLHEGEPLMGLIHQPVLHEVLIGDNESVTLNGEKITIRSETNKGLSDAVLCLSDVFTSEKFQSWERFYALAKSVRCVRTWGNCYGYALLAMGLIDIMIDPIVSVWDIAGVVPIVKGAGCIFSDYAGNPFSPKQNSVIAAKPQFHQDVLQILAV